MASRSYQYTGADNRIYDSMSQKERLALFAELDPATDDVNRVVHDRLTYYSVRKADTSMNPMIDTDATRVTDDAGSVMKPAHSSATSLDALAGATPVSLADATNMATTRIPSMAPAEAWYDRFFPGNSKKKKKDAKKNKNKKKKRDDDDSSSSSDDSSDEESAKFKMKKRKQQQKHRKSTRSSGTNYSALGDSVEARTPTSSIANASSSVLVPTDLGMVISNKLVDFGMASQSEGFAAAGSLAADTPKMAVAEARQSKRLQTYVRRSVSDPQRTGTYLRVRTPPEYIFREDGYLRGASSSLALGVPSYLAQQQHEATTTTTAAVAPAGATPDLRAASNHLGDAYDGHALQRKLYELWHSYDGNPEARDEVILSYVKRWLEKRRQHQPAQQPPAYVPDASSDGLEMYGYHPEEEHKAFGLRFVIKYGPKQLMFGNRRLSLIAAVPDRHSTVKGEPGDSVEMLTGKHLIHESIGVPIRAYLPTPYPQCPAAKAELMFVDDGHAYVNRVIVSDVATPCGGVRYLFFFDAQSHLKLVIGLADVTTSSSFASSSSNAASVATVGAATIDAAPVADLAVEFKISEATITNVHLETLRRSGAVIVDVPKYADESASYQLTTDPEQHLAMIAAKDNWFTRRFKRLKNKFSDLTGKGQTTTVLVALKSALDKRSAEAFKDVATEIAESAPNDVAGDDGIVDAVTLAGVSSAKELKSKDSQCKYVLRDEEEDDNGGKKPSYIHITLKRDFSLTKFFSEGFKPIELRFQVFKENMFHDQLTSILPGAFKCTISNDVSTQGENGKHGVWVANTTNFKYKSSKKGGGEGSSDPHSHLIMLYLHPGNNQYAAPSITRIAIIAK